MLLRKLLYTLPLFVIILKGQSPNCSLSYTFSNVTGFPVDNKVTYGGAGSTVPYNNSVACNSWSFSYTSTGFSALSISLQSAPATLDPVTPGTFVTFAGTTVSGSNPSTATSTSTYLATGVFPWIRVNLGSITGTGTLVVNLYGWLGPNFGGSGGSGSIPITSNILKGDGAGGAADAGFTASNTARLDQSNTFGVFAQTLQGNLNFGGTTSSFPALKQDGANLDVRKADDSGYTSIVANGFFAGNSFYFFNSDLLMYANPAIGDTGNAYAFADSLGTTFRQVQTSSVTLISTTSDTATVTWIKGSADPVGACTNGSLYSQTTDGKLFVCQATAWVQK